jgi:hypothetical protein
MLRILLLLACLLAASARPAHGQRAGISASSWVTELGAGAILDLGMRGPWIAPEWRQSAPRRVLMSVSVSLVYEYALEPWNGYANAARWEDAGQRFVGTISTEVLIGLVQFVARKL